MIFSTPKGFQRVSKDQFHWFLRALGGTKVVGANGTGYYDMKQNLVALECNGAFYVKP